MSKEDVERFLESVKHTRFFSMGQEVLPGWRLVYCRNVRDADDLLKAEGVRTLDVGYDRVRERAFEVAVRCGLEREFSSAWREAFRVVSEKVLGVSAGAEWCKHYSAFVACGDAGLVANCLVAKEGLPRGCLEYALKRWDVWGGGYALLGDYEGSFYVFAGKKEE